MKFQVRDGFVVEIVTLVDLGDGKTQTQTNTYYGKQICDLDQAQADRHFHKLEPKSKEAEAYLDSKVMPVAPGQALGLSGEAVALVEAMATAMATKIVAAMQTSAQPAAPAA